MILEDIVDSGKTVDFLLDHLSSIGATFIRSIVLFSKPDKHEEYVNLEDVGFDVWGFVVGYNLDWDGWYRNKLGLLVVQFWPKSLQEWKELFFPKRPKRNVSPSAV